MAVTKLAAPVACARFAVFAEGLELHTQKTAELITLLFDEIDTILMAADGLLSVQVGDMLYTVPTLRSDRQTQEQVQALVGAVRATDTP